MTDVRAGYKQTEVGVIPIEWDVTRLGELIKIQSGIAFSSEHYGDTGPILLTPGNFRLDGGLYFNERNKKHFSGHYLKTSVFDKGDLLAVMTDLTPECDLLGKPAFVDTDEPILHNQRIGKIISQSDRLDLQFLYWHFLSHRHAKSMKDTATGSTVRHTSNSSILESTILLPKKMDEQQAIAKTLGDVDGLIAALEALIAKKRDIKQGAMQDLLSGNCRLPGFTGEWDSCQLRQLVEFHKGAGLPKSSLTPDGKYECIHYGELFTRYGPVICSVSSRTNDGATPIVNRGDVLMPTSDVTPRGLAKASCVLVDDVRVGGDTLVISPDRNQLDGVFLALQVRHREEEILRLVTGSTVYHLYAPAMGKFEFKKPNVNEQVAIASVISEMDTEIAALEAKLAKSRDVKQGMMQVLLTGEVRLV